MVFVKTAPVTVCFLEMLACSASLASGGVGAAQSGVPAETASNHDAFLQSAYKSSFHIRYE